MSLDEMVLKKLGTAENWGSLFMPPKKGMNVSLGWTLLSMIGMNYYNETQGNNTGYSKFAKDSSASKVSSRLD
jgi:hypothetical protein